MFLYELRKIYSKRFKWIIFMMLIWREHVKDCSMCRSKDSVGLGLETFDSTHISVRMLFGSCIEDNVYSNMFMNY
jgi:hypothetical protein